MNKGILALDIATTTGWAYLADPEAAVGYGSFTVGTKYLSHAEIYFSFWHKMHDVIAFNKPETVVIEAPFVGSMMNANTARRLMMFSGLAEMIAHKNGVKRIREIHNGTVKKHFIGHGKATKAQMIENCRRKGWDPADDNEADALAVLDVAASMVWKVQL